MTTTWGKSDQQQEEQSVPKAKDFWGAAKAKHETLFVEYLQKVHEGELTDPTKYTQALANASWKLTEEIAKQSWRNGLARGESKK